MKGPWGYDLEPEQIEKCSFEIIEELAELSSLLPVEAALVKRVIHATGDPSFASLVAWSPGALQAGVEALTRGATIVTDVQMVRAGVSKVRAARFGSTVVCGIADEAVVQAARSQGITRAMVAVERAAAEHPGAIFAFGNAPTALFRLLDLIDQGRARPALIVGTVVGFVGAAESKDALMERRDVPWISCRGTKGGSNVAAACVNALLKAAAGEV